MKTLRLTNTTFSNFLSGQCIEVCILGSMFAIAMAIFNMPFIPLICVLIAITAFVPYVGAWVACFIGAFLIMVVDPTKALWFMAMFLVVQEIENNLIYPKVVGTSIGLPGMWVLVAVTIGGEIMGVAGMLVMIPLNYFRVLEGPYPFLKVHNQPWYMSILWFLAIGLVSFGIAVLQRKVCGKRAK